MMTGVTGLSQMPQNIQQNGKMTNEQTQKLTDVLSNYDADNLTDADAEELVSQIQELGISPGSDLANVLGEAGIDARGLAEQAGVGGSESGGGPPGGGPPPPPPSGANGVESVDSDIVSLIADAVESYETSDSDDTLWSILESSLQEAGYDTSEPLVDFYS